MVAIVNMAIDDLTAKAKYTLIKSVSIWLYEYDIHSVMTGVYLTEIFDCPACALKLNLDLH